jgi:hypothetical protein
MTAREHADEASRTINDERYAPESAIAHALTAIALVLTDGDDDE